MSYFTTFPANENPISEGGVWLQHNVNRAKVLTTGGNAFGTGTNNDGYAYLANTGDSVIETTIFRDATLSDTDPNSYEFEHLHRVTDDAGNTNAYELDCSYTGGFNIVRWSGATSFAVLTTLVTDANFFPDGAGGQWRNGYRFKSELVNGVINIYADSGGGYVKYFHYVLGSDTTNDAVPLASGDPAIALFTTIGSSNLLGFSDATITQVAANAYPTVQLTRLGEGPGKGPAMRRRMPQQFPTPAPIDFATPAPQIALFRAKGPGIGPQMRRRFPQRFPDAGIPISTVVAAIGAWSWAGKTSPLSAELVSKVGAYTWTGKQSPLSIEIVSLVGQYSWVGKTSPLSKIVAETVGRYSWGGSSSKLSTLVAEILGSYTWKGQTSIVTIPGAGGSVVIFYDGLSVADGLTYHKGLSRPNIILVPVGDGTYTVTKLSGLSDEDPATLSKETYLIDGDLP